MLLRIFAALLLFAGAAHAQTATQPTQNGSVTIAAGNTFQQVFGASDIRRSITLQNNNTNGDSCWFFLGPFGSATKAASVLLGPGGSYQRYYPYIPREAVSVTCTTTSDTFYADQQ
jgi:hypothetical protein